MSRVKGGAVRQRAGKVFAVVGVALLAAGCANITATSSNTNLIAARDLAMSVADPVTGTTQEMADLGSLLHGAERLGPWSWSFFRAAVSSLNWSSTNNDYELNKTFIVTAGPITGTATVALSIAFFTSTDAGGTGVQISLGQPLPSTIHSLTYNRQMSGDFSNSISGAERQSTSTSSFVVTGLNGASPGFTLNGKKAVTFSNIYSDGRKVAGTFTQTVNSVVVTSVLQSDGSYLVSAAGTIQVDYSATIIQANGTTEQVTRTATITLDGQKTVHVDMDGTDVDVDMTTGQTE